MCFTKLELDAKNRMLRIGFPHPQQTVICTYCGKEGKKNAMNRWHFDNCKLINEEKPTP